MQPISLMDVGEIIQAEPSSVKFHFIEKFDSGNSMSNSDESFLLTQSQQ